MKTIMTMPKMPIMKPTTIMPLMAMKVASICDGTHSKEYYTLLSCTNQSLQPNVSASESSLFIGPHRNPQQNARSKVKSYDIGEEPSDGENKCSISDEHVSSVGGGSGSITSRPDSFKSITKSSFDGVSRQPVLGQSIIGPVLNLHHAAPPREESLKRNLGAPKNIATRSSTMAVKALRLLQPAKGANEAKGKGYCRTDKIKTAQRQDTGNRSVVIPPAMMECLNKTEHKQIKLLLGKKKPALYYAWGEEYDENPKNAW
jgi:hypothetical protein